MISPNHCFSLPSFSRDIGRGRELLTAATPDCYGQDFRRLTIQSFCQAFDITFLAYCLGSHVFAIQLLTHCTCVRTLCSRLSVSGTLLSKWRKVFLVNAKTICGIAVQSCYFFVSCWLIALKTKIKNECATKKIFHGACPALPFE